jgi:F-box protein 11
MILSAESILSKRYRIEKLIARGGMGAVYKAVDQQTDKIVALKQSLVADPQLRKAFEREARILARLRHPVLPIVSDHFIDESGQFLVMQFIPGEDMGTVLNHQKKKFLSAGAIPWVLKWADQLLDALAYLHNQEYPIIHRDIKPQNIKITSRGEIKLLDFGLAKSAGDHTLRSAVQSVRGFTPQYAPLEQIQGTGTDERSDLYALAATLYHMLTGKAPVDSLERVALVLGGRPDPLIPVHEMNPLVPIELSMVIQQAMEQEKDHRFATATAMRTALRMASQTKEMASNKASQSSERNEHADARDDDESGSSGMQTIVAPPNNVPDRPVMLHPSDANQRTRDSGLAHPYQAIVVAQQGYGNYKTLGEAIANAQPGTRIIVHPGTYKEGLLIDKSVEIIGDGPVEKIIIENTGTHCIQMRTDYALVRGLTLKARTSLKESPFFAVDIPQGRLVLEKCAISSETRASVVIHGKTTNPILWQCTIHQSTGTGISFHSQARGVIEDCDIAENGIAGIGISQGSNPIIRKCTIRQNKQVGIYVGEKSTGTIEDCDIYSNERVGIEIKQESNPFIRWCKVHAQVKGYGIYVYDKGEGVIEECDIYDNTEAGIGIARGGNPFVRRCCIHDEKQRGIVTIDQGFGIIESCDVFNAVRMGIGIGKYANPIIRRCTIHHCKQNGMVIWDNGSGMIEECSISDNAMAGIEIGYQGNPVIRRCIITKNKNVAIIARKDSTGSVEECDLTDNKRGAWSTEDGSLVLGSENKE